MFRSSSVETFFFKFIYSLFIYFIDLFLFGGGLLDGACHAAGHLTCHRAPHPVRDALNDEAAAGGRAELTGGPPAFSLAPLQDLQRAGQEMVPRVQVFTTERPRTEKRVRYVENKNKAGSELEPRD